MLIDATQLMYRSLQLCRHIVTYTMTAKALNTLDETLTHVKKQGTFIIKVPDEWASVDEVRKSIVPIWAKLRPNRTISPANRKLFTLIEVGAGDLRRLWAAESIDAVRSLGYAFHMLPALLWKPLEFKPDHYLFCFRMVGRHWADLSPELRQAFCAVQGLTLDEAAKLIEQNDSAE